MANNGKKRSGATVKKVAKSVKNSKGRKVRHEHSAGFILFRMTAGGPVFLLLDYGRHWDYPKGHLEKGETAWLAAVRELQEETGIRQVDRVGKFQQQMHYSFYSPKKGRISKTVTYFLGKTRQETVVISDEHFGHAWLGYEDAMERLTYDNAREILRAAHDAMRNSLAWQRKA
ncbi:MAG: bis(5'-nucleosyl)-tetraphosphatase [Phycisphaerales bacterium]|nr:bis(5'-nucleosyl)-tetraphosphatase [Phycisphaerales bacterium]